MDPETKRLLELLYNGSDDAVLQYAGEIGGELRRLAGLAKSRGEWARRWREGMNWYRGEIARARLAIHIQRRDRRHLTRLKEEVCRLERRELELERREARLAEERDILQHLAEQVITTWRDERLARYEWGDDGPTYRRARSQFEDAMCALAWHLNPASRLMVVPPEQQAMPLDPPSCPGGVTEPSDDPC